MKPEQEEELNKSEERYRALFENAVDAIFIIAAEGIFTEVNASGERLLGYERGELVGRAIVDILQPEEINRFLGVRESLLEGKTRFDEWTLIRKDGTSIQVEISASMLPEKQFQAFVRDITERKRIEELSKRQTRHAALRADVQAAISSGGKSLQSVLQSNMESIVRHLDAAIARVWTLDEKEKVLHLQASAGIYTRIDKSYSRFPVGQYKVGEIAAQKKSFFSNAILEIEIIDKEWAMREGLISFAGFPLIVNDKVVGVAGMFSRRLLTEDILEAFESIAAVIALGVVSKRAEDSLREKQQLLQTIFDNSTALIHVQDLNNRALIANKSFAQLMGLSPEQMLGKTDYELWQMSPLIEGDAETDIRSYRAFDAEALDAKRALQKELSISLVGVGKCYFLTTKCLLRNTAGEPESILTIATDITEIKRAENELRANQQLLQAIFDNTPTHIHVKDLDGRFMMTNRAFEQHMRLSREEILGKTVYDVWKISPFKDESKEEVDDVPAFDLEVIKAGKAVQKENVSLVDGEERTYLMTKCPLKDDAGEPYSILTIATDVTESKRAEKELRRLQMELAHATRVMTMGALTTSIAHEVNQPLAAVVTNGNACLRWLAIDPPDLEEARDAVNRIIRDGIRASEVITRTRTLLKKSPPQKTSLDINEIVRETIALAQYEIQKNKILLQTQFSTELPTIAGDKIQLQQVLLNLMVNGIDAIKAETDGEARLSVETRNYEKDNILIAVKDSGIGLDAGSLDKIFESFYTTKKEGMGMGLSISRSIIEAHGGRLWATSNEGKGATFQFTLPVGTVEE